jgi:hypothetical protein
MATVYQDARRDLGALHRPEQTLIQWPSGNQNVLLFVVVGTISSVRVMSSARSCRVGTVRRFDRD